MSATSSVNQANAQRSTGPKTGKGKQISSLHALRHGLTGRQVTLPTEDIGAYRRHVNAFEEHLQPRGPIEANLVQSLADTAWRLNRVGALQTKLLKSTESLETQIKALSNLSLYTQRLYPPVRKNRKATPGTPGNLQETKRDTRAGASDGFVFSNRKINPRASARGRAQAPCA
jgi:hypothetical protein